jgi:ATP-dependent helicase IRC3
VGKLWVHCCLSSPIHFNHLSQVIFTQLIDRVEPLSKGADRTLILAHRQELVEQAAQHCTHAYPTKSIEIEMGSAHATGTADITIASVQSIISGDRISKFDPKLFKLVLVDEAHHIVAAGYMKTLAHFGLGKAQPDSPALVGVSATLSRADGLRLGAAIDHIVYHKDYVDMIGEKWLSDVIFTTVQSTADVSKVRQGVGGDFQSSELSKAVNTGQINEITVRSWLAKASGRKSTLVFCVDLAHVDDLTNAFRAHGIDARLVTGSTPKLERSARLDSFRAGEFPVLVNCGVFTEGTDIPNIDCVLLARPTKSRNLLVQMIGRGMRLHPSKSNCHVIDMVSSLAAGVVSTPTLFGLDPSELVDNASLEDLKAIQERKEAEKLRSEISSQPPTENTDSDSYMPRNITFTDYESVFDLIEDSSGERHIRAISPHNWVEIAPYHYILTSKNGDYLKLRGESPLLNAASENERPTEYIVTETKNIKALSAKVPLSAPRVIVLAKTFADAVHAADTYASKKYPYIFIGKNQKWHRSPASEGQLAFLNKLRLRDDPLTSESVTRGKAMDMITKIKHGARGRFASLAIVKRRQGKAKQKVQNEQAFREREHVKVGPLSSGENL